MVSRISICTIRSKQEAGRYVEVVSIGRSGVVVTDLMHGAQNTGRNRERRKNEA